MAKPPQESPALVMETKKPLMLIGPPSGVEGEFRLENPGDQNVIVDEPRLRHVAAPAARRAKAATAGATVPAVEPIVLHRMIVRPGQARPIPVRFRLDPHTAPGTYRFELEIDGQLKPVLLEVTEEFALTMEPDQIILPPQAGEKLKRRVVFTNEGNVPVTIHSLGTVLLEEELLHRRAFRGAVADAGDTMEDLDDFAVALGRRYKKLYENLVLKIQNSTVTIEPGDTATVELTITLPKELESRSRYHGYAAISTESLTFTIVPD